MYNFGEYGILALLTIFTLTWGWTLHKLYRDTKRSDKLLPKKGIFILHGSLLVLFLLLQALNIYAWPRAVQSATQKAYDDWFGIADLSNFFYNLFEAMTFGLVLFLMLPMGGNQKMKRQEF